MWQVWIEYVAWVGMDILRDVKSQCVDKRKNWSGIGFTTLGLKYMLPIDELELRRQADEHNLIKYLFNGLVFNIKLAIV